MTEPATFRTKSGDCVVSPERLVLERTGLRGQAAEALHGRSKRRAVVVYAVVIAFLGWNAIGDWREGHAASAAFASGLAAWLAASLLRARDFSAAMDVDRAVTSRVEGVRGWSGLTRDRLVVHFREAGRPARRFILMPGALQGGRGELDRALALLRAAGWPVDGA